MKYLIPTHNLGASHLKVSVIGLGCWQFSKQKGLIGKFWPFLSDDQTLDIVRVSLKNGINWFDSAEAYGWGASEESLSEALRKLAVTADEIVVATKWWPLFRFAASVEKTIDRRLKALNGYSIDLYQIHHPNSLSSITRQMHAMADLVEEKKIRYVGVSNFSAAQMHLAFKILEKRSIPLVSNQVPYSLLNRKIELNGILNTAKELGISIIAYSPLAQGILTGKFHRSEAVTTSRMSMRRWIPAFRRNGLKKSKRVVELLEKLSKKYDAAPAQVALNWLINYNHDMIFAIPGSTSAHQAEQNATALNFQLSADDLTALHEVSKEYRK